MGNGARVTGRSMSRMIVLVPSRGRPQNIGRLLDAWEKTHANADLLVAIDDDDPAVDGYKATGCDLHIGPPNRLGPWLNILAPVYATQYDIIGNIGDDHVPRTDYWCDQIREALTTTGIAYGDDRVHGKNLATQFWITSNIISALGWMVPPGLKHLYVDNAVMELGRAADVLTYLPEMVMEHMHPIAGRSEWDEVYASANSDERYTEDKAAFDAWSRYDLPRDAEVVHRLKGQIV